MSDKEQEIPVKVVDRRWWVNQEPANTAAATATPSLKPTYVAFLDDQVAWFYDTLPKGTFDFYFRTRATTEGSFIQPAARAEMMYDGTVTGNSAGARVDVVRK